MEQLYGTHLHHLLIVNKKEKKRNRQSLLMWASPGSHEFKLSLRERQDFPFLLDHDTVTFSSFPKRASWKNDAAIRSRLWIHNHAIKERKGLALGLGDSQGRYANDDALFLFFSHGTFYHFFFYISTELKDLELPSIYAYCACTLLWIWDEVWSMGKHQGRAKGSTSMVPLLKEGFGDKPVFL